MCPGLPMPPSAMTGTPYRRASCATLYTAEACARPHAHTSCVVQIEPMPMPRPRARGGEGRLSFPGYSSKPPILPVENASHMPV
eukprot:5900301-Pyramimonas_sp.AAC.1